MDTIVSVSHLYKKFKEITAVNDLSFTVARGEVYGFIGQNGAGKSTTIRMLLTLVKPTGGTIQILGMDLQHNRTAILKRTGAIIERPDLYKYLTGYENLKMCAALSGAQLSKEQLMRQLAIVGLQERAHSKVKTYSQGMKQRLGIATALAHDPDLIILDEPTNGLDPQGIADVRNLILHLSKNENKTLIISSHLLSEMELIADAMLIIDKGKKVAEGKVKDLFNPADTVIELQTTDNKSTLNFLQQTKWGPHAFERDLRSLQVKLHGDEIPVLTKMLVENGAGIKSLHSRYSLEDYFLSLTTPSQHVEAITH